MSNLCRVSSDLPSVSPDDFDADWNNFTAPIPPHERQWRHPSELREQTSPQITAPSLQRVFRLVAIGSACLSVVISLALLRAVIPRPSSVIAQKNSTFITPETTSLPMPVGSASTSDLRSFIPHLRGTSQPVIAMTRAGYFLSSALDMKQDSLIGIVDIDGTVILAQVVYIDKQFGIAWLRSLNIDSPYSSKPLTPSPPATVIAKFAHGDVVWIINNDITTAAIGLSTKNAAITNDLWPVNSPPGSILGGLAVDEHGRAIGWCVYINGAQWVIPMAMLENLLREVDIASSYERQR